MICKGLARKRSWSKRGIIPAFSWRDRGKPRKTSARIANVQADLRNEHLPDMSQEQYLYNNTFGATDVYMCARSLYQNQEAEIMFLCI
jgi:hypothetical protein